MKSYVPPYREGLIAGLAVFILYALTLAPTTAFWDASEYIATAHIVGIPHPPGNPLFVILGKVWTLLLAPTGLSVAVRVNLFSAATSAAASGFYFLIAHRLLSALTTERWTIRLGAAAATLLSATAFTVWNQSTVNEKVYTVSMLIVAAVSWLALLWFDRRDDPKSLRYLLIAGYLLILGSTNHLMSLLPGPALLLMVALAKPSVFVRSDFWSRAIPIVILGLSVNFFLPIRSAQEPVINEGHPTCESAIEAAIAVYSNGSSGCRELAANLSREQYGERSLSDRQAPITHQFVNYYQYFDWQWARSADPTPRPFSPGRTMVTVLFGLLGLFGLLAFLGLRNEVFAYFLTLTGTVTVGLVFYLNFKYGYSLAPEITDPLLHEVRERDYFFVIGFGLWGMLSGIGLTALWIKIREIFGQGVHPIVATPLLGIALIPLVANASWASRANDYAARDWAYDLLMSVEPYGILFTNGDNDTFPLWYLQEVEEIRQDVTVVVGQYLYTDWYPKQLQVLTRSDRQRPFDSTQSGGIYEDPGAIPSEPIITLAPEQMDRVLLADQLREDLTLPLEELAITYPAGMYLERGDMLALRIIADSHGTRPIYFAGTTNLMDRLRLERWGVRQGLAIKFIPRDMDEVQPDGWAPSTLLGGEEWVDVDRSMRLMDEVFLYRGLDGREIWPDLASVGIPYNIAVAHYLVAQAGDRLGYDLEALLAIQERGDRLMVTARGGSAIVDEPPALGPIDP